jgi:hypothetical protein
MTPAVDLDALLSDLEGKVKTELASTPTVQDVGHDLDVNDLPIAARRWLKVTDVVAVVAELPDERRPALVSTALSSQDGVEPVDEPSSDETAEFEEDELRESSGS